MKLILRSGKPKRLMGPEIHHDGFKLANSQCVGDFGDFVSLRWLRLCRCTSEYGRCPSFGYSS